jgi:SAM-dependent methyltransferase
MDLHDYKDVADNYDLYVETLGAYSGFEEPYLDLAAKFGSGGIIDIGCGTGTLLLPLVKAGYDVTGLDISEAMIDVATGKLNREGLTAKTITASMTDFDAGRQFSLAVIARSGFSHLTTPEQQRQALLTIKRHLVPGGVLSLTSFQPLPEIQAMQCRTSPDDYTLRTEYINADGMREQIYNAIHYDPNTQIMSGNWKFVTLNKDGEAISERIRPVAMRQSYVQELLYLFEICGYENINYDNNNGGITWLVG